MVLIYQQLTTKTLARADFPEPVKALILELKRLPSIGPRSAERIAVWILQNKKAEPKALAQALIGAHAEVLLCENCGFFATKERCDVCDDDRRDDTILCVVEQATDVLPIERSGAFKGRYHCLGGRLSPLDRVAPEDLNIHSLLNRLEKKMGETEVILALGADVEGEATSNYLAELMRNLPVKVTRIAQGLPAGGGLEHADELTLIRALQGRRDF